MEDQIVEIRWHGRAGQGVVTASELLAEAALDEGKYFQALPEFGAERTGAPIRAYTRISSQPLRLHSYITDPSVVAVLDSSLIGQVDVVEGLREEGAILVNTSLSHQEVRDLLGFRGVKVYTVDATRIALDSIGRNIPNAPILAAVLEAVPVLHAESALRCLQARMASRVGAQMVEANPQAFRRAQKELQAG